MIVVNEAPGYVETRDPAWYCVDPTHSFQAGDYGCGLANSKDLIYFKRVGTVTVEGTEYVAWTLDRRVA
jgi:hypothetical protein